MNYGLYLSASGMLGNMHKMDVLSNNLANAETPGFKALSSTFRQRDAAAVEDGLQHLPSDRMLERLGGGIMLMPGRLSTAQGEPERSDRALDVAIEGEGFLVIRNSVDGELRLTRDGRLAIGPGGSLVQAASGQAVLDRGDRPISVRSDAPIVIDRAGVVRQRGVAIAQIQITKPADVAQLRPAGHGTLSLPSGGFDGRTPGRGAVLQGFVERSSVDPVMTMIDIASAERAIGSNSRLIQLHDQMLDRAVNSFGRVA